MTKPAIRKWRVIVAAKARRCERVQADLRREREVLSERHAEFDEALQVHTEAQTRQAEHEARIAALFDGSEPLATSRYLLHDTWRGPLKEALEAARVAQSTQRTALERQQAKVSELQTALSRVKASLDECQKKLNLLLRAAAVAAELVADEEAAENLLARRHAT